MAIVSVSTGLPSLIQIATGLTGNVDSNIADRGRLTTNASALVISNSAGATPTVTVNIMGSPDNSNWFNAPYALFATPTTFVVTAITLTTTATNGYVLQTGYPWRYLKITTTLNTNETLGAYVVVF